MEQINAGGLAAAAPASTRRDKTVIEADHLSRSFGQTRAAEKVTFEVKRGEILGFLGPNGAGKSTTLRMITGLLAPDEGTARICGIDIASDPIAAKMKFGYLPESIPLYDEMEVIEYLRFVGTARGLVGLDLQQRIDRISTRLGLKSLLRRRCGTLSKGYRQRVGLAQALIHDPEVVILDEPTNGLDPRQIIEVRHLIRELAKECAVIFSTHILQEIAAICSRIIVIHSGRLIADGTPEELAGEFREGWQVVVEGSGVDPQRCEEMQLAAGTPGAPGETVHQWLGDSIPDLDHLQKRLQQCGSPLIQVGVGRESLEQVYLRLTGGEELKR
ncbi:MAG: ABC transporter ATP-binding protein [Planctomycetota bacterium]|nr:ABC transporter ATP-binding protein [Planctomycetota bacterium]